MQNLTTLAGMFAYYFLIKRNIKPWAKQAYISKPVKIQTFIKKEQKL